LQSDTIIKTGLDFVITHFDISFTILKQNLTNFRLLMWWAASWLFFGFECFLLLPLRIQGLALTLPRRFTFHLENNCDSVINSTYWLNLLNFLLFFKLLLSCLLLLIDLCVSGLLKLQLFKSCSFLLKYLLSLTFVIC